MSTMLSDKVEQVGGASAGVADGLLLGEPRLHATAGGADVGEDLRRWKADLLAAVDRRLSGAGQARPPQATGHYQSSEALSDVGQAVRADFREVARQIETCVLEHPLKALGAAVGVGFLLGVIWSH
jgi:hypothetical protein